MSKIRPSFDTVFMNLALDLAKRSTCIRLQVGAVITSVDHRYVLGMGYNANASGLEHKCDSEEEGKCGCIHAECNAMINCNISRDTSKLVYITTAPCKMCAKMILNLGNVKEVIYKNEYRGTEGLSTLYGKGIVVRKLV